MSLTTVVRQLLPGNFLVTDNYSSTGVFAMLSLPVRWQGETKEQQSVKSHSEEETAHRDIWTDTDGRRHRQRNRDKRTETDGQRHTDRNRRTETDEQRQTDKGRRTETNIDRRGQRHMGRDRRTETHGQRHTQTERGIQYVQIPCINASW